MTNENQKGTQLVGGALTDEVMESSDSILSPGMYGQGQKGLQQFYSPPEAARLAHKIMGDNIAVLDPTAGDGSLLAEFNPTRAFGIEIDADQIKAAEGKYNPLKGDFQHFYTLLRTGMSEWNGIVANPPFGLQWSDPTLRNGKETNSTVLTMMMVNQLLADEGQFMFICALNRYERQITKLEEHSTVYAVIDCDDLFDDVSQPSVILFGVHDALRSAARPGVVGRRSVPRDMLDLTVDWVIDQRNSVIGEYDSVCTSEYSTYRRVEEFKALQDEYNRRIDKRIKNREFDAQLFNGDHIQWYPSAFSKVALLKAGLGYDFEGLNGQHVNYFAQNERLWFKIGTAEELGIITVDPRLRLAVAGTLGDIQKHRIPLYAVKPQQRLGFLDDIDTLVCKKDDPERRFKKHEIYRLDTSTKTLVIKEDKIVESKKKPGEYTSKTFEKHQKVMSIKLSGNGAHYSIIDGGDNASQDIGWLIEHFDIPDPGEIESRHPEKIAALEALVTEVFTEFEINSAKWEETHPVSKPFTIRDFQVRDIARMLFKEFAVCAWEQGLGKTVGGLAFYIAATKLRASKKLLITCPGDLIPQWTREIERFLGVTPTVIKTHGQAKKIAKALRMGGEGIYIIHYEGMAINGTLRKNIRLPVVTVKEWDETVLVPGTDKHGYWLWFHESSEDAFSPYNEEKLNELLPNFGDEDWTTKMTNEALEAKGYFRKATRSYWCADGTRAGYGYVPPRHKKVTKKLTSKDICPECQADTRNGWNGTFCEATLDNGGTCGYAHFSVKMKPIASLLSTAFHDGVALLDEITFIQGNDSKRSKAMRGVEARYRLGLSGTPIKNYVNQIFWPLAWCLGYEKPWFPYSYDAGMTRFEADFCVIEYQTNGRRKEARKVLPDVTNLSRFWRMVASHNIRRRQEETGEDLVDIYYHEVKVPLGLSQAEQTKECLKGRNEGEEGGFPAFFKEKYPDAPVVKAGLHKIMAPMLGLNWKLDYACVIPRGDPDFEWTEIPVENWTPANLRTLELTMALVKQGRKVLVGSHLVVEGQFLAEQLVAKGVKAVHIVDETSGNTIDKDKRAKKVYQFQTDDDVQVFCAGMKAIRLGHNLDAATAVVINGLDFDYETLDQFVKRVRRLTSVDTIDVFIILPTLSDQATITSRKWEILNLKGNAADLALDGRLVAKNESEISEAEMIRELQERGLTITDEAVEEIEIQEAWKATLHIDNFVIGDTIPPRPPKLEEEKEEVDAINETEGWSLAAAFVKTLKMVEKPVDTGPDAIDLAEAEFKAEEDEEVAIATNSSPPSPTSENAEETSEETPTLPLEPDATASAEQECGTESSESPSDQIASVPEETQDHGPMPLFDTEELEPSPSALDVPSAPLLDPIATIKGAKELLDLGIIEQVEFEAIKLHQMKVMAGAA